MSPDEPAEKFDVAVEPAPKTPVIAAEPADEEKKRRQDAALASTYDPAHTHDGKTDEELIEERHDADLLAIDAAIVVGIAIAAHEAHEHDHDADDADGD